MTRDRARYLERALRTFSAAGTLEGAADRLTNLAKDAATAYEDGRAAPIMQAGLLLAEDIRFAAASGE